MIVEQCGFKNAEDFYNFKKNIENDSQFVSVLVDSSSHFYKLGFSEYWYMHLKNKAIWRLVEPDPPFNGIWERVK